MVPQAVQRQRLYLQGVQDDAEGEWPGSSSDQAALPRGEWPDRADAPDAAGGVGRGGLRTCWRRKRSSAGSCGVTTRSGYIVPWATWCQRVTIAGIPAKVMRPVHEAVQARHQRKEKHLELQQRTLPLTEGENVASDSCRFVPLWVKQFTSSSRLCFASRAAFLPLLRTSRPSWAFVTKAHIQKLNIPRQTSASHFVASTLMTPCERTTLPNRVGMTTRNTAVHAGR